MSATNGHAASPHVREQIETARAELELRRLQEDLRSLQESDPGYGTGGGWGSFVDPFEQFRGFGRNGDMWLPMGQTRQDRKDGGNKPFVWTDFDLDMTRSMARWLATKNGHCTGALESLADYTVRTGFTYESKPGKRFAKDGVALQLASLVQDTIDEFSDLNSWPLRQWAACLCAHRDGEKMIRSFVQNDGTTLIRDVWPEQVRQPLGSPATWSYGVLTPHNDAENPLAYAVEYGDESDWEEVPASELSHLKLNVDSCVKRGLSDLFGIGEQLDEVKKLLRNLTQGASIQAAIAWFEIHKGANAAAINAKVAAQRDKNRPYPTMPITGREINFKKFEPGSIVSKSGDVEIMPSPTSVNSGPHIAIVQAALRAIAARWRMPEYMVSSDASNANYSSTLVAGAPFVTRVECRQKLHYAPFFLRILWTAVRNAASARRFIIAGHAYGWEEITRLVDINVTPPAVAITNKQEQATIDNQNLQNGVLSIQTARAHAGLDSDQEDANLAAKPLTRTSGRVTDLDAAGNPVGGQDGRAGFGGQTESKRPVPPAPAPALPAALAARYAELRERYGGGLAGEIAAAAKRLVESVPNKSGPGCHDEKTGHPAECGGASSKGGKLWTHGTVTSAEGHETTFQVEPHPRGGFRSQRVVKLAGEPESERGVMDYTHHKTFQQAKDAAIKQHAAALKDDGASSAAPAGGKDHEDKVASVIASGKKSHDDIAKEAGLTATETSQALLGLELADKATRYPNGVFGPKERFDTGAGKPDEALSSQHTVTHTGESAALVKDVMGRDLEGHEVAALVGAPSGAKLTVKPGSQPGSFHLRMEGDGFLASRTVYRDVGKLICKNGSIELDKEQQGKGLGSAIFAAQVKTLSSSGFAAIRCNAERDDEMGWNGYYTWARLGYDGAIPERVANKLPPDLAGVKRVQELMAAPGGREWWKANGDSFAAEFSLNPDSQSMQIMTAYMAERAGRK